CSKERQSRIPGGIASSPTRTVEPVLVTAETDSKNASGIWSSREEASRGTVPTTQAVNHRRFTRRKPKRVEKTGAGPCVASAIPAASPPLKKPEIANTRQSLLS